MIKKTLQFIFSIYAFAIFVVVMLLLFPFFIAASLLGGTKAGNAMYGICRLWADVVLFCWGIKHINIFKAPKANHAVIFVFNHISYIDIPIMMKVFRQQPIRILAKAEMSKIPLFGYIYKKVTVMVDRNSEAARLKSVLQLKDTLAENISIVLAPEGTFNQTNKPLKDFYNGAFKIAVETQVPIQPVVFLDAYDRLHYNSIFSLTPGKSRAVFLPIITAGNDVENLKGKVFNAMEKELILNEVSWVGNDVMMNDK